MRAHCRLAKQRECRAHAVHHAHHALVDGLPPLVVGEVLESADRTRSRRVDEHVQLTVPSLGQLVEYPLDGNGVGGVGHQPDCVRAPQCGQFLGRLVEHGLRSADDGHPSAVLGQTARGREAHAAPAADDYRRGVRKTEVHGAALRYRSSWARASRRMRSRPLWRRWT